MAFFGPLLGYGASGLVFAHAGDEDQVIKLVYLPDRDPEQWEEFANQQQAKLFEELADMDETPIGLPKVYHYMEGEVGPWLEEEVTNQIADPEAQRIFDVEFWPGRKFALWMIENVPHREENMYGSYESPNEQIPEVWSLNTEARMGWRTRDYQNNVPFEQGHYRDMSTWLLDHGYLVRDVKHLRNLGYRHAGTPVWYDPNVVTWPLETKEDQEAFDVIFTGFSPESIQNEITSGHYVENRRNAEGDFESEGETKSIEKVLERIDGIWNNHSGQIMSFVENNMAGDGLLYYLDKLNYADGSEIGDESKYEYLENQYRIFRDSFADGAWTTEDTDDEFGGGTFINPLRFLYVPVGKEINTESLGNWETRMGDKYGVFLEAGPPDWTHTKEKITSWLWSPEGFYPAMVFGDSNIDHMEGEEGVDFDCITLSGWVNINDVDWASTIAFNISAHSQENELCIIAGSPVYDLEWSRNGVKEREGLTGYASEGNAEDLDHNRPLSKILAVASTTMGPADTEYLNAQILQECINYVYFWPPLHPDPDYQVDSCSGTGGDHKYSPVGKWKMLGNLRSLHDHWPEGWEELKSLSPLHEEGELYQITCENCNWEASASVEVEKTPYHSTSATGEYTMPATGKIITFYSLDSSGHKVWQDPNQEIWYSHTKPAMLDSQGEIKNIPS